MNTIDMRNIAEQVEKNKQDILKHFQRDEVLADFGIRIIGQVATVDELYRVPQEGLEYGDAYAVGTQSPFNYYIWTRANNLSPSDYWFDFGEIAIAGPQGPKGDRGEKGATGKSTRWYLENANWDFSTAGKQPGDMVLISGSGQVYMLGDDLIWGAQTNIKGPQGPKGDKGVKGDRGDPGPQGPQGPTGDVGGFINISGIVANEYELPDPAQVQNLTVAFLVGNAEPYNLYIQVGRTSGTAQWMDMGPLNVATMVTVNGQYQNTWNADTKLDKIPLSQAGGTIAYTRDHLGNESYRGVSASANGGGGAIPVYNRSKGGNNGILKTSTPEADDDCANKVYVDNSQFWSSIEEDLGGMDDEFYISLEAGYQYQVSASIKITYSYRQDGRDCTEHINFNTGSLYVPDEESVHSNVSVSSFVKLDASATAYLAPNFQGMYVMVGEHYQDELYEEGPNGTVHYKTRVYVAEPQSYPDIEVQELQVIVTWKKVY